MLLLITWVKFRVQKYSYFLHLQNYIAVFYNFFLAQSLTIATLAELMQTHMHDSAKMSEKI